MEAIAFDAVSDSGWGAATRQNFTFDHTPVGAPTVIVVTVHSGVILDGFSTKTYGGEVMTELGHANGPTGYVYMLALLAPPAGVQEVVVTFTADACRCGCICRSYIGDIGNLGPLVTDGDTEPDGAGAVSIIVPGVVNGIIVDGLTVMAETTPVSDGTSRASGNFGSTAQNTGAAADTASAGTVEVGYTSINAGSDWGLAAFSINPPPTGGVRWFF
jgi:hypothetical protein